MWTITNISTGKEEKYYSENEYKTIKGILKTIKAIVNLGCKDCEYGLTCEIDDCGNYKLRMIEKVIDEVLKDEHEQKS